MVRSVKRGAQRILKGAFLRRYRGKVSIGKDVYIPFQSFHAKVNSLKVGDHVRFGSRMRLEGDSFLFGDYFFCGSDVHVSGHRARFEVGKFSSFGRGVSLLLGKGNHRIQSLSNFPFGHVPHFDAAEWTNGFAYPKEASTFCQVGHDVWIGVGSIVLPNVTIGHGAVVSTGSVVRESIPPYAIVGGNPAQIISFRFKPSLIQELLELRWWDWPVEKIHRNIPLFTKNLMTRNSLDGIPVEA